MIFNKTTEYALTILGFMALSDEEIFSAEYLHEKLNIPRRYLRKLLTDLSKLGFICSGKGRKGGFVIAKPLEEINLSSIIASVEGAEIMGSCLLGHQHCKEDEPCVMHETWLDAKTKMMDILSKTTLKELKERNKDKMLQEAGFMTSLQSA